MNKKIYLLMYLQFAVTAFANDNVDNLEILDHPELSFEICCNGHDIEIRNSKTLSEPFLNHGYQLGKGIPRNGGYWWKDLQWLTSPTSNANIPLSPPQQDNIERESLNTTIPTSDQNFANTLNFIDVTEETIKQSSKNSAKFTFINLQVEEIKNPPKYPTRGRPRKNK